MDMLTTESPPIPIEMNTSHVQSNRVLAEELNDAMRSAVMPVSVFVGVEAVVGFIGNILILYVFIFRYHVCNFKYFVICLSMIDLASCLTTLPGEVLTQTFWYVYPVPMICKVKSFFNMFTVESSAFLLLIIAIDRHRKICHPFGWQIRRTSAKLLCLVTLCFAFILSCPIGAFWGTHNEQVTFKNVSVTVTVCEKDELFWKTNVNFMYSVTAQTIIGIQMFVMIILYMFIAKELFKGDKDDKKRDTKAEGAETHTTNISCVVTPSETEQSLSDESRDVSTSDTVKEDSISHKTCCLNINVSHPEHDRKVVTPDGSTEPIEIMKMTNENVHEISANRKKSSKRKRIPSKVKRKTKIMFTLTAVFILTTVLYLTLLSFITKGVLSTLSSSGKSVYFFFFRLYFINHVINPFLYGLLDAQFRMVMKELGGKMAKPFQSVVTSMSTV